MRAIERLGVAAVVGAAGGVAHVTDGRPAIVLAHDALILRLVIQPERLDDGADLLVRVENLAAARVERSETRRKLPAILQVQKNARHQPRDAVGASYGRQPGGRWTIEMVNRRNAAFVVKLVHVGGYLHGSGFPRRTIELSSWNIAHYRTFADA